jgi:thiosulfate dehydrogenase [quinone] large subunit
MWGETVAGIGPSPLLIPPPRSRAERVCVGIEVQSPPTSEDSIMATHGVRTRLFDREVTVGSSGPWMAYWTLILRLVVGWWFLYAGLTKYAWFPGGEAFSAGGWMTGATQGTLVHPITAWAAGTPWMLTVANVMVPLGETLIGLGLLVGCLVRLASAFGVLLMFFFYFGNADFAHGYVNGDLFGLLLFVTMIVWGAGRVFGLDAYLERTALVENNPRLRYLLG